VRALIAGAHPDDVEIYCWGLLCAWAAAGATLTLAVATDGARGGAGDARALAGRRRREAEAAAATLGLAPRFLDFPDGALTVDVALVGALRALAAETQPDVIVTHCPEDYHADHRALAAAVDPAAGFVAPVAHMDAMGGTGFAPTLWVDVMAHMPAKRAAIRAHESQDPERFVAAADRLAAFRAGPCNAPEGAAEAFRFAPRFPFADVRALFPPPPPLRAVP
jgi:LmbE family N-acetylglucosaminyl deacetylase